MAMRLMSRLTRPAGAAALRFVARPATAGPAVRNAVSASGAGITWRVPPVTSFSYGRPKPWPAAPLLPFAARLRLPDLHAGSAAQRPLASLAAGGDTGSSRDTDGGFGDDDDDDGEKVPPRPITKADVGIAFCRSSGPGGQNVNKVSTKVDMRLSLRDASWIPGWVKRALYAQQRNRINTDGELVVTSDRHRTQPQNVDDALEKLQEFITKAAYIKPEQTEASKAKIKAFAKKANERRLMDKKAASARKEGRGGGGRRGGDD